MNYQDQLKNPKWQKKRLEIMKRDKFKCKLCGDTETSLHVHHKDYEDGMMAWEYPNSYLITLCEHCHEEVEDAKRGFPDISFDEIEIYKSNNWVNGGRIMFTKIGCICSMVIYDAKGQYTCGFNLKSDLDGIIKILRRAKNG